MSQADTDYQPPDTRIANWQYAADRSALEAIRRTVFIEEQSVPEALEWDDEDASAHHFITRVNNTPAATARLLNTGQIGRMAVLHDFRGQNIGSALLRYILRTAPTLGLSTLFLHAQTHAIPFYEKFGFVVDGDEFMDAGIPHRNMQLFLPPDRQGLGVGSATAAVQLSTLQDFQQAALQLITSAKRSLCIFSDDLEPELYDTIECKNAIAAMARRSRYATVRIIVRNKKPIVENSHKLLRLAQQLSTNIEMRILGASASEQKNVYLISDDAGLLLRKNPEVWSGLAWGNYRSYVHSRLEEFNELWNIAESDPDLRQLRI